MAEEQVTSQENENLNRAEERIRDLSTKAKEAYAERDAAKAEADAQKAKLAELEANLKFTEEFGQVTSKFPQAADLKDKIQEKVKAGYTAEDAALSVLNAEGKLSPREETVPIATAPGSSAAINLPDIASKKPSEMSREERRAALIEAINRGDITVT